MDYTNTWSVYKAGATPINTVLLQQDCNTMRQLSIQCTSMGTSGVITVSQTNDPSGVWTNVSVYPNTGGVAASFNTVGVCSVPVYMQFVRLTLTTATTANPTNIMIRACSEIFHAPVPTSITASTSAGTSLIGDVGLQVRANATGACTLKHIITTASTNSTIVKVGAGRLLGGSVFNGSAATVFVKAHNIATGPVVGTTAVATAFGIPAGTSRELILPSQGLGFATGIGISTTGLIADNDTTAVAAGVLVELYYA